MIAKTEPGHCSTGEVRPGYSLGLPWGGVPGSRAPSILPGMKMN